MIKVHHATLVVRPVFLFFQSPGRRFDVGGHRVEYEASDEAGWSSKCVFTVVLRQEWAANPSAIRWAREQGTGNSNDGEKGIQVKEGGGGER